MNSIARVQQIYEAFGKGDVPAILAALAEDVQWEYGGYPNDVPWLQPQRGRANVVKFFEALAGMRLTKFEPRGLYGDERTVVALIDVEFTVVATGKTVVESDEVHVWHFDADGRVARFRHRVDTWQHVQALRRD